MTQGIRVTGIEWKNAQPPIERVDTSMVFDRVHAYIRYVRVFWPADFRRRTASITRKREARKELVKA